MFCGCPQNDCLAVCCFFDAGNSWEMVRSGQSRPWKKVRNSTGGPAHVEAVRLPGLGSRDHRKRRLEPVDDILVDWFLPRCQTWFPGWIREVDGSGVIVRWMMKKWMMLNYLVRSVNQHGTTSPREEDENGDEYNFHLKKHASNKQIIAEYCLT